MLPSAAALSSTRTRGTPGTPLPVSSLRLSSKFKPSGAGVQCAGSPASQRPVAHFYRSFTLVGRSRIGRYCTGTHKGPTNNYASVLVPVVPWAVVVLCGKWGPKPPKTRKTPRITAEPQPQESKEQNRRFWTNDLVRERQTPQIHTFVASRDLTQIVRDISIGLIYGLFL